MKKYILSLSIILLGLTACTEDIMDKINKNNQNPSPDAVPAVLQITDAIMSTGFSTVSGDYAFYLSSANEQEIGIGNNQLKEAELRNSNEWAASTTFNNVWNSTYGTLKNIREIERKVNEDITGSAGATNVLGMAQVLEAINFGVLTSMHGDIPYSEAVKAPEILQPKLDKQEDVYNGILATLDEAINNLKNSTDLSKANEKQDIAFGGKVEKWLSSAYALKARYLLHQLAVKPEVLGDVEVNAQEAIKLGFDGFKVTGFNGVSLDNPWSAYVFSRYYTAPSKTVSNLMEATDDPRLEFYLNSKGESYEPGDQSIAITVDNGRTLALQPTWYLNGSQPIHLMSKSELYFILAEAQLRSGKDATSAFQTAVRASIEELVDLFWEEEKDKDGNVINAVDPKAFAESLGAPTLQKLFEQKYIAQSHDEQVETYNDLRRLKAMGEEYVKLTNPKNTQSGLNRYPERLPYGNSGVIGNPNVKEAYGDGSYIYTTKTWVNDK